MRAHIVCFVAFLWDRQSDMSAVVAGKDATLDDLTAVNQESASQPVKQESVKQKSVKQESVKLESVKKESVKQESANQPVKQESAKEEPHAAHAAAMSLEAVIEAQSALLQERHQQNQPDLTEEEKKAQRRRSDL